MLLEILSYQERDSFDNNNGTYVDDGAENSGSITLQVKLGDDIRILSLTESSSVGDLKTLISKVIGIDAAVQILTLKEEVLLDHMLLNQYGLMGNIHNQIDLTVKNDRIRQDIEYNYVQYMLKNENKLHNSINDKNANDGLELDLLRPVVYKKLVFDYSKCYKDFSVHNDGITLCLDKQPHASFRTGLVGTGITEGVVKWDIVCDKISPQKYTFIGVTEWPSDVAKQNALLGSYLGGASSIKSWGYYSVSRKCYSQSHTKTYGKTVQHW